MKKYLLEGIIVLVILSGLFTLILLGIDGEVKGILALTIGIVLKGIYDVVSSTKKT